MGMYPKTILVASITPTNGQVDEFLETNFPDFEIEGDISLVPGSEHYTDRYELTRDEESFSISTSVTYGWGDHITLEELAGKLKEFEEKVSNFCDVYSCTYAMYIGATFD